MKKESGQALVEAVIISLVLFGIFFSLIQLFLISSIKLVTLDAVFSGLRAKIVNKDAAASTYFVLSSQQIPKNIIPLPLTYRTYPVANWRWSHTGGVMKIHEMKLLYFQKMMFPYFFSTIGLKMLPGESIARHIASPEPRFFDFPYPLR